MEDPRFIVYLTHKMKVWTIREQTSCLIILSPKRVPPRWAQTTPAPAEIEVADMTSPEI